VEAKVLLKVRLEHIRAILEKALDTIGEHPEILRILARSLSRVVRESLGETLATLDDVLGGLEVGDTVDEALRGRLQEVRDTLEDILERSERGAEGAAQAALGEGPAGAHRRPPRGRPDFAHRIGRPGAPNGPLPVAYSPNLVEEEFSERGIQDLAWPRPYAAGLLSVSRARMKG
jgi:hypothetical protein